MELRKREPGVDDGVIVTGTAAMSAYQWSLTLHIAAGALALVTFWAAALLRKGSGPHKLAGRIYLLAVIVVILTAVPLTVQRMIDGHEITAAFLCYLLVILSSSVWMSWRAIRDKHDVVRYTGRVYGVLAWSQLGAGGAVLAFGLQAGQPLLIGFSFVGLFIGQDMLRRRGKLAGNPRWWLEEHYGAMLGNGVATHIAFLGIGLTRLLPMLEGPVQFYTAWFGPLLVSVVAKGLLDRRYRHTAANPPVLEAI